MQYLVHDIVPRIFNKQNAIEYVHQYYLLTGIILKIRALDRRKKMNRNLTTLLSYLEQQQVYLPVFLENAGMSDFEQVNEYIKDMSMQELTDWVNTIV